MKLSPKKKYLVLGILFFLPVIFLLFLYPAKHNYQPLDVIKNNILELNGFQSQHTVTLQDHLTVVAFVGNNPMQKVIEASNLKELIYDKFKGFKKFQIVLVATKGKQQEAQQLVNEISMYETLKYLQIIYGNKNEITTFFNSLKTNKPLDVNLSTPQVFIIDKDRNQRGRLDDRTDREIEKQATIYPLISYNCIEIAELKNKMGEDLRVLFTEYRQKRKGDFNSTKRRENNLKQ